MLNCKLWWTKYCILFQLNSVTAKKNKNICHISIRKKWWAKILPCSKQGTVISFHLRWPDLHRTGSKSKITALQRNWSQENKCNCQHSLSSHHGNNRSRAHVLNKIIKEWLWRQCCIVIFQQHWCYLPHSLKLYTEI